MRSSVGKTLTRDDALLPTRLLARSLTLHLNEVNYGSLKQPGSNRIT
jgi:hypothetical protein